MIKIDKLFTDKKSGGVIYILLAVGIMLIVFGSSSKQKTPEEVKNVQNFRTLEAEAILSHIKGAGRVSVMISETEKKENSSFSQKSEPPKGEVGVLIVADGGNDGVVREKLIRAASVALGVSPHKIEVFERE